MVTLHKKEIKLTEEHTKLITGFYAIVKVLQDSLVIEIPYGNSGAGYELAKKRFDKIASIKEKRE